MSATGTPLSLSKAELMAAEIIEQIDGEAYVVGSIRRKKADVGDIEILVHCDAKIDLDVGIGPLFSGMYETIRGGPRKGNLAWRYWQLRCVANGIHIDLFRFDDDNRGSLMVIRTGPATFSKHFVTRLRSQDLEHKDGYIRDNSGAIVSCTNERQAFSLAQLEWMEPEKREPAA